eukprot:6928166-Pyramimonas_sp.AAC.1
MVIRYLQEPAALSLWCATRPVVHRNCRGLSPGVGAVGGVDGAARPIRSETSRCEALWVGGAALALTIPIGLPPHCAGPSPFVAGG